MLTAPLAQLRQARFQQGTIAYLWHELEGLSKLKRLSLLNVGYREVSMKLNEHLDGARVLRDGAFRPRVLFLPAF